MGKGGKTTKTEQQTQQQTIHQGQQTLDPNSKSFVEDFLRPLGKRGADVALNHPDSFVAGPNAAQQQALQGLQGLSQEEIAQLDPEQLMQVAPELLDPTAFGVNAPTLDPGAFGVNAATVDPEQLKVRAQQIAADELGFEVGALDPNRARDFLNPFQNEVIAGVQSDFDRQRDLAERAAQQEATAAKSFGGSRSAILEAEALSGVNRNEAQTLANLRAQGFNRAQDVAVNEFGVTQNLGFQSAAQQQQADLQAKLGNQQADLRAQLGNQTTGRELGLANQRAQQEAALANQQVGSQIGLANQQAGLQAGLASQQAALNAMGMNQDALLQAGLANQQTGLQAGLANLDASLQGRGLQGDLFGQLFGAGGALRDIENQQRREPLDRFGNALNFGNLGLGPTGTQTSGTSSNRGTTKGKVTKPGSGLGGFLKNAAGIGLTAAGLFAGGPAGGAAASSLLGGGGGGSSVSMIPKGFMTGDKDFFTGASSGLGIGG